MCSVLGVSRSGYYKWRATPPSDRKKRAEQLQQRIEYHFLDNDKIYGSPKITKKLQEEGFTVGEKTVGRIMRANNFRSEAMRKFNVQTTDSNHDFPIVPNWLNQHFDVCTQPNQVWVTDITHIRIQYIEFFYNRKRIHSKLGYLSPDRFESLYYSNLNLAI